MGLPKIVAVVGTNASGKSSLGVALAKKFHGEIISADSRQLYRGFDLCCGKITESETQGIPHHLLDIRTLGEPYSPYDFQRETYALIPRIIERGRLPFIVGGTGNYTAAVTRGYVFAEESGGAGPAGRTPTQELPELQALLEAKLPPEELEYARGNRSDWQNRRRLARWLEKAERGESILPRREPKVEPLILGVTWPKEILDRRIEDRLNLRLEQGMLDEVRDYLAEGGSPEVLDRLGLEYRFILYYLQGRYGSLDEFRTALGTAIKQFAKRQITYFKKLEGVRWLDMGSDPLNEAASLISDFLKS